MKKNNISNFRYAVSVNKKLLENVGWENYADDLLIELSLEILGDIELIDLQLSSRDKQRDDKRVCAKEYHLWRHGALQARSGLLQAKRAVCKELQMRKLNSGYSLVKRLLAIAETVDGEDLSVEELKAIEEAKHYIEVKK